MGVLAYIDIEKKCLFSLLQILMAFVALVVHQEVFHGS
jgi:hypothetical protein